MRYSLLPHLWKGTVRSLLWYRNLAANIFLGIVLFLLALNLLGIGLFIDRIFKDLFPAADPISVFNSILLYYFFFDLLLRFFFQKTPGMVVQPYLHLPVARSQIVHFLLIRSTLSVFNSLPLLIFIPFALKIIQPAYSLPAAMIWIVALFSLILSASFFHFYMEKLQFVQPQRVLILLFAGIALMALERLQFFSLSTFSKSILQYLLAHPYAVVLPLLLLAGLYWLNFNSLKKQLYLDCLGAAKIQNRIVLGGLSYLEKFGEIGDFLALEFKLLLRNKRPRSNLTVIIATVIIVPLFYYSIADEFTVYPQPESAPAAVVAVPASSTHDCLVTFRVIPGTIPPNTHVYLTGNHAHLGNWQPAYLPLMPQPDSSWSRAVAFAKGTQLRYIFTLGSWQNESGKADGKTPDVQTLEVANDTTLIYALPHWKTPRRPIMVDVMIIYMGLLATGFFMLVYGQFIFSWESNYFDWLISRPLNWRQYLDAKFAILLASGVSFYLLNIPLVLLSRDILLLNTALLLYNLGVNTFVLLAWATFARKRMDLSASSISFQGKGGSHFVIILPIMIVPIFVYLPFALTGHPQRGFIFMAILGVAGLILRQRLMAMVLKLFNRQKYKMAMGFRQP